MQNAQQPGAAQPLVQAAQQQQQQQQVVQQVQPTVAAPGGTAVAAAPVMANPAFAPQQQAAAPQAAAAAATSSFPHQGLNGGWQSDKDYQERRKMIGKIVLLLQQRKPNAPQEWLKKLPQMAKRLEESLYRSAKSFAEYNDANTLKQRLQQLAVSIGMNKKKMQQAQILQHQQQLQQQVQQQKQAVAVAAAGQIAQQPMGLQPPVPVAAPAAPVQAAAPQPARMVNMAEINPMIAAPATTAAAPVQQVQYAAAPVAAVAATPAAPVAAAPAAAVAKGGRVVSDRQQVLRHQQQRLLLLRHAAKCQHEDNRCPVTPHCAGMKRLWKHIAECKNQQCLVPHCVSSRYVLSHYHRCKDVRCPVCGPVREAIHRSHEKQKNMQALKQGHRQAVQQSGGAVAAIPSTIGAAAEPANKRRKTAGALPAPAGFQGQVKPLVQPASMAIPSAVGVPVGQQSRPGIPKRTVAPVPGLAFSNGQVIMPKTTGPKPQEDHTLINCFSVEQIELHIASLNNGLVLPPLKLKTKATEVLRQLQSHQHAWVFNTPVDPVELGLPDYFQVIKHPMDLGSVRKKLENGVYHRLDDFEHQVKLTFDNAMMYNPEGSVVYNMAKDMKSAFEASFAKLLVQLNAEEDVKRRNGEACLLCGCEKLLFEPPVFYCNGMNCPSKRIRRNSYYYVAGNNQYHWCHQCYQEIRDNTTLDLGDLSVAKEAMTKKKNDEVHEESWVQCDRCERWVHQICALFNTRQNKDQSSEYACPRCTVDERKKQGSLEATSTTPMAEDLPRTKLSEYLENHVRVKVEKFLEQQSKDKVAKEGITIEEARKKVEMGGAITIRQVTSMDRKLEVRERMKKRYAFKNYPDEFNFRCKCIVVFQNLDGVDVILFGLYVYEHDENNPAPNTRAVYVSYLDSVHYMRPRSMRTFIYHEILISYLDYVRKRGFATAHIWACPPLKGDDYILYAKPEDQKVPKDDRLRQWYIDMLVECQRRGIVGTVTNMYDLYFSDPKCDATMVPYMDGDYFPAEAENIIKDIEDGKAGKKVSSKGKNKDKKAKQKKKSGRSGTRSAGLDEDALQASGLLPPGADKKSLEDGVRDFVMVKLGETIQPMKESFIVAYLAWEHATEEQMVVPKEIQEHRDKLGITWKLDKSEIIRNPVKAPIAQPTGAPATVAAATKPAAAVPPAASATVDKPAPAVTAPAASTGPAPMAVDGGDTIAKAEAPPTVKAEEPAAPTKDSMDVETKTEEASDPKTEETSTSTTETNPQGGTSDAAPTGVKQEDSGSSETVAPAQEPAAANPGSSAAPAAAGATADTASATNAAPAAGAAPSAATPAVTGAETANPTAAATALKQEGADASVPAPAAPAGGPAAPDAANGGTGETQKVNMAIREGKFAAMAKKRDLAGDPKEPEAASTAAKGDAKEATKSESITVKDSRGRLVKVLDDDDEELDCEFLNNRQAFLNLCQGNHYQYDQVRRAKHSSMMVLWHLHNRDAPKFVQQCATCSREILTGFRFHCPTCADFDQCQECYQNPNIARHLHQLKPVAITNAQQSELSDAQRKERQRSIQLHMTLLLHAATCTSPKCPSANCTKMKGLLKHGQQCQVKATGGCNVCKRIWALLQIHARQCKAKTCPVPNCMAIRERVRQLKKQQQAMDDRRRQEMNRAYRGKR